MEKRAVDARVHQDREAAAGCEEAEEEAEEDESSPGKEARHRGGSLQGDRSQGSIVWRNVVLMALLHVAAAYSLVVVVPRTQSLTWMWSYVCFIATALGVTAGAHRLWSHRSYRAKLPLRVFLAAANSMAFQNDIFEWARDHRVHHKYTETDADPHNATRGFFFSHIDTADRKRSMFLSAGSIGWLFVRKHRDVIEKGKKLDVTDLLADPVVRFQRRYYKTSVLVMCFLLPTLVPWYVWGESLWDAYFLASILRYAVSLNMTWLVNSAAHMYGNRPYDKSINPRENWLVTFGAIGEGFHNFHHTFPFDYSTSEFGLRYNPTTCFIDLMCWCGLASDRKKASVEMVQARRRRTGDGSA
ncbi:stearoyl-CoA desaturase 5-like [Diretmus argenteus]